MDDVQARVLDMVEALVESGAFELTAPNSARALAASLVELVEKQPSLTDAELEEFLVDSRDLAEVFDLPGDTLNKLRAAVSGDGDEEDPRAGSVDDEDDEDALAARAVEHEPLSRGVGAFLLEIARIAKELADEPWDTVVLELGQAMVNAYFQRAGEDEPGNDVGPRVLLILQEGDGAVDVQRNQDASVTVRALPFAPERMIELGDPFALRIFPPIFARAAREASVRKALSQAARAHEFFFVLLSGTAESIAEGEDLPIVSR